MDARDLAAHRRAQRTTFETIAREFKRQGFVAEGPPSVIQALTDTVDASDVDIGSIGITMLVVGYLMGKGVL